MPHVWTPRTQLCGPCEYLPGVTPPTCGYISTSPCGEQKRVRPGGINHKGVVDFWRRKKDSYTLVSAKFHAALRGEVNASLHDRLRRIPAAGSPITDGLINEMGQALPPTGRRRRAALRQRRRENADPQSQC